jgi:microcompartment protein CcmK/EutM
MIFARVVGTVVATRRSDRVEGPRFMLTELTSCRGEPRGDYLVALDGVGAGIGELVMIAQGPSARQTPRTDRQPVDALICGIIDLVEERGALAFRK